MIKRTPKPAQLAGMVLFALSCFGLILYLWVSFGGPVPLKPEGYRVSASFDEAVQLATEADVRISGVNVGKVKKVTPHLGRTDAELEIQPRYAPLPNDVRAILRSKTLLGETFIDLSPGSKKAPKMPDHGRIGATNISDQVQLDEVIRTFDAKTRAAFGDWLIGQSDAVQDSGDQLNQAFGVLPMFFQDSNSLMDVLHRQQRALSRIFRNTSRIFDAVDSRPGQLTDLIVASNKLLRVTANRSQQLVDTFNNFPEFLREVRKTTGEFQSFADGTQNMIKNTEAFADASSPLLKKSVRVSRDARVLVNSLEPMLDKADKGLPATNQFLDLAKPTIAQLDPFLAQLNPIFEFVGLYRQELVTFAANDAAASQGQATQTSPARGRAPWGHFLRAFVTLTPDNLAYFAGKTEKTRSNAYPVPGWFDRLADGLQVFDAGTCTALAVPPLDPDDTLYVADGGGTNYEALLPLINKVIYAGESTPYADVNAPTTAEKTANLGQSPGNAANLPAPACAQQPSLSFQGTTSQFPHVNPGDNSTP